MGYIPDYQLLPELTSSSTSKTSYGAESVLALRFPDQWVCFGFRQRFMMILIPHEGPANFGMGFWYRDEFYRLFFADDEPGSPDRVWGSRFARNEPLQAAVRGLKLFMETDGTPVRGELISAMRLKP